MVLIVDIAASLQQQLNSLLFYSCVLPFDGCIASSGIPLRFAAIYRFRSADCYATHFGNVSNLHVGPLFVCGRIDFDETSLSSAIQN